MLSKKTNTVGMLQAFDRDKLLGAETGMGVLSVDVELCAEGGSHEALDNVEVPVVAFPGHHTQPSKPPASGLSCRRTHRPAVDLSNGERSGAEIWRHDCAD